jgi:hypothetical protein
MSWALRSLIITVKPSPDGLKGLNMVILAFNFLLGKARRLKSLKHFVVECFQRFGSTLRFAVDPQKSIKSTLRFVVDPQKSIKSTLRFAVNPQESFGSTSRKFFPYF